MKGDGKSLRNELAFDVISLDDWIGEHGEDSLNIFCRLTPVEEAVENAEEDSSTSVDWDTWAMFAAKFRADLKERYRKQAYRLDHPWRAQLVKARNSWSYVNADGVKVTVFEPAHVGNRECMVPGCMEKIQGYGLCWTHYYPRQREAARQRAKKQREAMTKEDWKRHYEKYKAKGLERRRRKRHLAVDVP